MITLPRHAERWLPGLLRSHRERAPLPDGVTPTVWLLFTDHFEPRWRRPEDAVAAARVRAWRTGWAAIAARHRDDFGRPPQYTFFYPQEEYAPWLLDPLAELRDLGIADVEVHIHHDGEGERDFLDRMTAFIADLRHRHGLLREVHGRPSFGFIHGNWALDNSHPSGRWCGLNNELTLLRHLGCYADFTLPAAPDPCQTRRVNSIYWAVDDPAVPRSHDDGIPVTVGGTPPADGLLMVQGPLTVRFDRGWWRPQLEVGELAGNALPTRARAEAWLDAAPRVGSHLFVKLHGHGAPEKNAGPLLEGGLDATLDHVAAAVGDRGWRLGFVTAYQAAGLISELATGRSDPLEVITRR